MDSFRLLVAELRSIQLIYDNIVEVSLRRIRCVKSTQSQLPELRKTKLHICTWTLTSDGAVQTREVLYVYSVHCGCINESLMEAAFSFSLSFHFGSLITLHFHCFQIQNLSTPNIY